MSANPFPLRWERSESVSDATYAYRGEHMVGMVVWVPSRLRFTYSLDAVHWKFITKGRGFVKSERAAKKAVERAWNDWCAAMGFFGK